MFDNIAAELEIDKQVLSFFTYNSLKSSLCVCADQLSVYFIPENLVLPPGCRHYATGRKLGQVRDDRLCHLSNLPMVFRRGSGFLPEADQEKTNPES